MRAYFLSEIFTVSDYNNSLHGDAARSITINLVENSFSRKMLMSVFMQDLFSAD
ncbi:hypothetical protein [Pollutibacter soli]|uniref:hypothetical protein n=1 Tax=Pollutibacter soli TaxID=3034157 RepID=UPI003013B866